MAKRLHFLQLARGGVALRNHHIENGRSAQLVLALRAGQRLLLQFAGFHAGLPRRARLPHRRLGVDHVQLDAVVELPVLKLLLAIVQLVGDEIRLRGAVAQGHGKREARAIVREIASEHLAQHRAIAAQEVSVHVLGGARLHYGLPVGQRHRIRQGVHLTRQTAVAKRRKPGELRQHGVLDAQGGDAGILQANGVLLHVGAVGQGFRQQVLDGPDAFLRRNLDMVGGHDARAHHRHVVHPAASEHALEDHLLLQDLQLGGEDVLLARLHFGLRLDDVDGSDGPQLRAPLVVLVQLLVQLVGVLLHFETFIVRDQVPVEAHHVGDAGHHLILESEVGNMPLVLGYANGPAVDRLPESLQQVLLDGQLKGGLAKGAEQVVRRVLRDAQRIAHAQLNAGAGQETLLDSKGRRFRLRHQVVRAGDVGGGFDLGAVGELAAGVQNRVQVGNGRARQLYAQPAQHAALAAAGTGTGAGGAQRGARGHTQGGGGRTARNAARNAAQQRARADALRIGVRQLRIEAGVFDIQVVLQRQRDGVFQRQVNVAGAHQLVDPRRIFEADPGDRAGHVVPREPPDDAGLGACGNLWRLREARRGTKEDSDNRSGKGHNRQEPQETIMADIRANPGARSINYDDWRGPELAPSTSL